MMAKGYTEPIGAMMNSYEYFDVPLANRNSASEFASRWKLHGFNTRVPTRTDVALLRPDEVSALLENWIRRSATEVIPSRSQISQAKDILLARPDASEFENLIKLCDLRIGKGNLPW